MSLQGQETIHDLCSEQGSFSADRFFQFLPAFLTIIPGSIFLFILFDDWPFGIQIASSIVYTAAAFLHTFSGRGLPRYLLDCPVVQHQWDRLTMRHFGFLIVLCIIETIALKLRTRVPHWWLVSQGGHSPPFTDALFILCGSLLLTEVITNRSVLKRAHLEHYNSDH